MQGRRSYMEDRISITDFADANGDKVTVALVYDGHGGHEVSEFSRSWFPTYLINHILINYTSMDLLDDEIQAEIRTKISNACLGMFNLNWKVIFRKCDSEIISDSNDPN